MRWKAIFHNPEIQQGSQSDDESECKENYGLKTARCPSQVVALKRFEEDLLNLVGNITFRRTTSDFQKKMSKDMNDLRKSGKTLTPADKTTNLYRLNKDQYNKLKTDAITATYKRGNEKTKVIVDKCGTKFAKKAGVLDRIHVNGTNNCFITLKDHKDNFENNPKTRLINPAKNEIGRKSFWTKSTWPFKKNSKLTSGRIHAVF